MASSSINNWKATITFLDGVSRDVFCFGILPPGPENTWRFDMPDGSSLFVNNASAQTVEMWPVGGREAG